MKIRSIVLGALITSLSAFASNVSAACTYGNLNSSINGCSDEGVISGSMQNFSLGNINFTDACIEHDLCYRTLGRTAGECEAMFLSNLREECISSFPTVGPLALAESIARCAVPNHLRFSVLKEVRRWGRQINNEVLRLDDNLKDARDLVVDSLVDGLEVGEEILATIPGGDDILDVLGRPSELLQCSVDAGIHHFNSLDPSNIDAYALTPPLMYSPGNTYAGCVIAAEAMHRGVQGASNGYALTGSETFYETRQIDLRDVLSSNVVATADCEAKDFTYLRPIVTTADAVATIGGIFKLFADNARSPSDAEIDYILGYAPSDPDDWQFEIIRILKDNSGANIISGLNGYAHANWIDVDDYDEDRRYYRLRAYHDLEVRTIKQPANTNFAGVFAAF